MSPQGRQGPHGGPFESLGNSSRLAGQHEVRRVHP